MESHCMAYETGTVSTPEQLLDAIRLFMVGADNNTYVEKRWDDIGTNNKTLIVEGYSIQQGGSGLYPGNDKFTINFRTVTNEKLNDDFGYYPVTGIFCTISIGEYDENKSWDNQSNDNVDLICDRNGIVDACGLYGISNNTVYHFIYLNKCIIFIIEPQPGVFHHLGIMQKTTPYFEGECIILTGSFGGDDYILNAYASKNYLFGYQNDRYSGIPLNDYKNNGQSHIYNTEIISPSTSNVVYNRGWSSFCYSDPRTGRIARSIFSSQDPTDSYDSYLTVWHKCPPNTMYPVTPFIPYRVYFERENDYFSPYIELEFISYINITDYEPLDTVILHNGKHMIFPGHSKNGKSDVCGYMVHYDNQVVKSSGK